MACLQTYKTPLIVSACLTICCMVAQAGAPAENNVPEDINQLLRTRQYTAALTRLEALARKDHVGALKQLATLYRTGRVVPQDRKKAYQYLRRAASMGDGEAQFYLGKLLLDSPGSENEYRSGLSWLERAAEKDFPGAAQLHREMVRKGYVHPPADANENRNTPEVNVAGGATYLVDLAAQGNTGLLAKALKSGLSPNTPDRYGRTALTAAVEAGQSSTVRLLLKNGANTEHRSRGGNTALMLAVKRKNLEIAKLLLNAGALTRLTDKSGNSPLMYATRNSQKDMVRLLINHGADIDALDADNWSVLDVARATGEKEIYDLLVSSGATSHLKEIERQGRLNHLLSQQRDASQHEGLLFRAIAQKNLELLVYALNANPDLAMRDKSGFSPLTRAVQTGEVSSVRLLLQHGAAVQEKDARGYTAVHYAIDRGDPVLLETLLSAGNIDPSGTWGERPLHYAIRTGHPLLAINLLKSGFLPNLSNDNGEDDIEAAVRNGAIVVLDYFSIAGYPLEKSSTTYDGLFRAAVEADQIKSAVYLQKRAGDRVLAKNTLSELMLIASGHGNAPMLKLLTELGSSVDPPNSRATTPLMAAVARGCLDCVDFLIQKGASVDARDAMGNTALHIAILNGKPGIAQRLIDAGADQFSVNRAGESYRSILVSTRRAEKANNK